MTSWRDRILSEFLPDAHSWVIVTDLDRLFDDAELQKNLTTRGYEPIFYDGDSIALRHRYETSYRLKVASMGTILIVYGDANTARRLPYDLLSSATLLSFGLSDLFPHLNDPIIAQCLGLDLTHMDALFAAAQASPQMLGATATKDFLLRSIFALDAQAIQNDIDLLRSMLQLHHRELLLPSVLLDRFVEILKTKPQLANWDLKTIISDRPAFLNWFQAQWQLFAQEKVRELRDSAQSYKTKSPALPLDNPDLRFYIEELFRVRLLEPISAKDLSIRVNELEGQWLGTGIAIDSESDHQLNLQAAITEIEAYLLKFDTQPPSHQDWFALTPIWAQAIVHWHETKDRSAWQSRWNTLQQQLDSTFQSWLQKNYDGLYNYPVGDSPVMLHHIPKFLARRRSTNPIALIVLDGMAFDQWLVLRDVLTEQMGTAFSPIERATLAMLPTLTSISRQAIFAGKLPNSFADSLGTTAKEAKQWETFWCDSDNSLVRENIAYLNIVGDLTDLEKVRLVLSHPRQKVLGLVVDKIDNIMHGMTLGTAGMHAQVGQWAQQGFMKSLLELLRDRNYDIYLTADHGNLEATGIGQPSERAFADVRGERVRIYGNTTLREATQAKFPTAIGWTPKILPADSIPLFAPDRTAFVRSGEQLVCHGGISIEEVIVPFISIK
jgi:PglZ domain